MLILSDFSDHCYSIEDSQQQYPYQQLCPSVFFGPLDISNSFYFTEQLIKVIITCGSTSNAINLYNELNDTNLLMFIVDDHPPQELYDDSTNQLIMNFQTHQCNLLTIVNDKFNTDTSMKISSPFITLSDLLKTLHKINYFIRNFKIHYPDLSILMDFNKGAELSTLIPLAYLNHLNPKVKLSDLLRQLHDLNPSISLNLLRDPYYNEVLTKLWESNYYSMAKDDLKRSLTSDVGDDNDNDNDNDNNNNDDLKRKKL